VRSRDFFGGGGDRHALPSLCVASGQFRVSHRRREATSGCPRASRRHSWDFGSPRSQPRHDFGEKRVATDLSIAYIDGSDLSASKFNGSDFSAIPGAHSGMRTIGV